MRGPAKKGQAGPAHLMAALGSRSLWPLQRQRPPLQPQPPWLLPAVAEVVQARRALLSAGVACLPLEAAAWAWVQAVQVLAQPQDLDGQSALPSLPHPLGQPAKHMKVSHTHKHSITSHILLES